MKTHNKTGLNYLGKTSRNPFEYKGSGIRWSRHIKEHGYDVNTKILLVTDSKEELKEIGIFFSKLFNIVESKDWANLTIEEGQGGNTWDKRGRFVSEETRIKQSLSRKGKPKSNLTKLRMKKPKSAEHKMRISEKLKNRKRPTKICFYCNKEIGAGNFQRWHGDNCKNKTLPYI
jgi:hypothetical protein